MRLDLRNRDWYQLEKPHDFAIRSVRPAASTASNAVAERLPFEGHSLYNMDSIQFQHSQAVGHRVAAAIERRLMADQIGPQSKRI